ncbi:MAG: hypothetical protein COA73_06860 [Candidatus Hydrogenedentota bacterium]|nr:MAG: hypothetical protein COA73_06860 [Candidatus Hydrogenedentota bacterium]
MTGEILPEVEALFLTYPKSVRDYLMALRILIFETAQNTDGVGRIQETMKWGQPSYITSETGSGTTIRIDRFGDDKVAFFFHCQTTLGSTFRDIFGDQLQYEKNRAIILDTTLPLPEKELETCIGMALTYHLDKK